MKIAYLFFAVLLIVAGCAKEKDIDKQQSSTVKRTGLAAVANADAQTYVVMVVGNDTIVLQDTDKDSVIIKSGKGMTFPFQYYDYTFNQVISKAPSKKFSSFALHFDQYTSKQTPSPGCGILDTLIKMGVNNIRTSNSNFACILSITDREGSMGIVRNTYEPCVEVTSIENLSGCKVRVQGKISNLNLYNDICGPVPVFTIKQAVFQQDFVWEY